MFTIISDGGCDFTKEEAARLNVEVIPFYITFDGETHLKEGVDITKDEFFGRLVSNKTSHPKTSQPSPQDYIDVYTPHLKAGRDIVSVTISSKLSGSHNSAVLAAEILREEFPERAVAVLDSQSVSIGQGLIVRELVKMRTVGFGLHRAVARTEEISATTRVYFTLDSLEYLKKGGRIGPTTAFVGGILGLRPILHMQNGEIAQLDSVRGKKNAYTLIRDGLMDALKDETRHIELAVGHILSEADAVTFQSDMENALNINIPTAVTGIGAAIGTHAGPGALAFAYCKKYTALAQNPAESAAEERRAA